ncbi:MAG: YicC/YloC family endoribonuclease [Bacteroidota bacterium]|nr:YicC/YloC family endoribonuclease [Bacteroidota bacterium]
MIRSMTGYGKAEGVVGNRKYNIEVRSLNSKQFDLNTRIPSMFREKEMELRKLLRSRVIRGKCDFFLFYELDPTEVKHEVNTAVVENYIEQLKAVPESNDSDLLALAMSMPEAMQSPKDELDDDFWVEIEKLINESLDKFDNFRGVEGEAIESDFVNGIKVIRDCSADLDPLLDSRLKRVRERIRTNLEEAIDKNKIDETRFEQEVLFYIEKQDVSEERSRLAAHCDHFEEILSNGIGAGKKLGFVAQEIGREINTLGSKANDADIQRVVVQMKDELEKIKEQIPNVL